MAKMSANLAAVIDEQARAKILFDLDHFLRETIQNEELFQVWLEEGVPDGTESAAELSDIKAEDFAEMWNLAEDLLNQDMQDRR